MTRRGSPRISAAAASHPGGTAHPGVPRPDRLARSGTRYRGQVFRAHDPQYLDLLRTVAARGGGRLDADTVMGRTSLDAALVGAGAAVAAARYAMGGEPAFAAVRSTGTSRAARRRDGFLPDQ